MPLPKLLQKALTALLRTVELTTDPKQAVQILTQHFTLSSHDLMNACQLSYEHALQAISIGLGRADLTAPHVVYECAQEVVRDAWETFVSQRSLSQVATVQAQVIGHCQTLAKLPVFVSTESRALTEAELAAILLDKGALNLTQLVLDQWQSLPAAHPCLEPTLVAFFQHDDLFGQALWFCFQEQLRREPRVATTLQTLATQGLWQDMRELKQHLQQQMKAQQVSAEIKPQDEVVTQHTSESLRFIAQAVQRLKRLPVNHPQYSQLAIQGASLLSSAGELERAEGLLQQAKQVAVSDTDLALAAFNLFQVLLRRGKAFYAQALRELQEAIQLHRERYALHDVEKYPIVQILGAGGMGCVFLCSHRLRKEQVVVKCFWEKRTGAVEEVFKEAFAMCDIAGEYVPKPLDYGWAGLRQRAFFVTEYWEGAVDGETWLETQDKLTAEVGWQVGWQIAKGLQLAHQQGVLHLDLKPANLLLRSQGSQVAVKLIDFGLSQLASPLQQQMLTRRVQTQLSTLGQTMFGTLDYASPEQVGYQQYGKPSEKSDVFGYGQTMKRLLSGKMPKLCRERDLPESWRELLFDCIEDKPEDRPSVVDLLQRLDTLKPATSASNKPITQPFVSEKPTTRASTSKRPTTRASSPKKSTTRVPPSEKQPVPPSFSGKGIEGEDRLINVFPAIQTLGNGGVSAIAYSRDGRWLAVGCHDDNIRLFQVAGERYYLLHILMGHIGNVTSVAFDPQGQWLASGSIDNTVKLWAVGSGQLRQTLKHEGSDYSVYAVAFDPQGRWLASGSTDKTVKLWTVDNGQLQQTLTGHENEVRTVAFDPQGRLLASGSEDKTIKLWTVGSWQLQRTLTGHEGGIFDVAFDPHGRWLGSGSRDKTVKLWTVDNGQLQQTLMGHEGSVYAVAFDPQGRWLASGSWDETVKLWAVGSWQLQQTLTGHSGLVSAVTFDPQGRWLASGSGNNVVKLWVVSSGQLQQTLTGHKYGIAVTAIAFDSHGQWLASSRRDDTVKLWAMDCGQLQRTLMGHKGTVLAIAFDPQGQWLASGSADRTVKLWAMNSGQLQQTLIGHESEVEAVAFDPQGRWLASGSYDTIKLWVVGSGQLQRTLTGHKGQLTTIAFDPQGQWLASGTSSYDISTAAVEVKLWAVDSGQLQGNLTGHKWSVTALAFDFQGQWLASGSGDKTVKLWAMGSWQLQQTLTGHERPVNAVAFDPQGQWLASGSEDNTVRIWKVADSSLFTVCQYIGTVNSVAFTRNGKYVVAAGSEGHLAFYEVASGQLVVSFHSFDNGGRLVLLPDGRFDGDELGMEYLRLFERGTLKSYAASEVKAQFWQPEAVKAVLRKLME